MKLLTALLLALLMLAAAPAKATADDSLTEALAATFGSRPVSDQLHSIAHERAAFQVAFAGGVCNSNGSLTHDGWGGWYGEVLACNYTTPQRAVEQWLESPDHNTTLTDPRWTLVGCAIAEGKDGSHFYVCVVGPGTLPTEPPVQPLPDTSLEAGRILLLIALVGMFTWAVFIVFAAVVARVGRQD
jgi:hypothetical protein